MTCSTSLGSQKFSSHILGFISLCNTSLCVQKKKKKTCFPFIKYVWFLTCMSLTQKKKKVVFASIYITSVKKTIMRSAPRLTINGQISGEKLTYFLPRFWRLLFVYLFAFFRMLACLFFLRANVRKMRKDM